MKFQVNTMLSHAPSPDVGVKNLELKDEFEAVDSNAAIIKAKKIVRSYYKQYQNAKVFSFSAELHCVKPVWRTRFRGRNHPSRSATQSPKGNRSLFLEETLDHFK